MKEIIFKALVNACAKAHKERTGNVNCIGSVKHTIEELLPTILEIIQTTGVNIGE